MAWSDLSESERGAICERIYRRLANFGEQVTGTLSRETATEQTCVEAALKELVSRGVVAVTKKRGQFAAKYRALPRSLSK